MMSIPNITLNDGVKIPVYGFGTYQIPADGSTYKAVREALDLGIRHIDTAVAYFNEQEVGHAIRESGIPREEIFLTSKLWLQDYGYEAAKKGIETSLRKLGLDYMDLYLIHQPYGDVPGAWKAMEEAKAEGKIRSIGVSNMTRKSGTALCPSLTPCPLSIKWSSTPTTSRRKSAKLWRKPGCSLRVGARWDRATRQCCQTQ